MRNSGKDTVQAAKTVVDRDRAQGPGRDTARRTQEIVADRTVRAQTRNEPHLYPKSDDK